jgi:DNA-binding NarL/FixJ family response regulator
MISTPTLHPLPAEPPAGIGAGRSRVRVFIVVGHEFVRRSLAALIDSEEDMGCCGGMEGPAGVTEALCRYRPDLVVVDMSLRRGIGLELIQMVRAFDPHVRILALALGRSTDDMSPILDAGVEACVREMDTAVRIVEAIRRAYSGPMLLDQAGAGWTAPRPLQRATPHCRTHLGATEREIVELIGLGVPARQIAARLGLSVPMIAIHRRRIRAKLRVLTATQFVDFCFRWVQQRRAGASAGR